MKIELFFSLSTDEFYCFFVLIYFFGGFESNRVNKYMYHFVL